MWRAHRRGSAVAQPAALAVAPAALHQGRAALAAADPTRRHDDDRPKCGTPRGSPAPSRGAVMREVGGGGGRPTVETCAGNGEVSGELRPAAARGRAVVPARRRQRRTVAWLTWRGTDRQRWRTAFRQVGPTRQHFSKIK
jgi:hypothetical protein